MGVKLNIGCSDYLIDGWKNLDKKGTHCRWEEKDNADKIYEFDATQIPWVIQDDSVETILFSHTLNQIPKEYHIEIFQESYRVLKNKGKLMITDDDNTDKNGKYYEAIHEHAKTKMEPHNIYLDLLRLGFNPMFVGEEEFVVSNHKNLDTYSKFFLEGTKWDKLKK